MTRTELGRKPFICDIKRKPTLYIKYVKLIFGSLGSQALEFENKVNEDNNIFQLVRKFTPFYQVNLETQDFRESLDQKYGTKQNDAFYTQVWKTEIAKLPKTESYLWYMDDIRR